MQKKKTYQVNTSCASRLSLYRLPWMVHWSEAGLQDRTYAHLLSPRRTAPVAQVSQSAMDPYGSLFLSQFTTQLELQLNIQQPYSKPQ